MRIFFRKLAGIGSSFPFLIILAALCISSIFIVMSATSANELLKDAYSQQIRYLVVGAVVFLTLSLTPYETLVRISPILYAIGVILLVGVYIPHVGKKVFGAHS